MLPDGTHTSGNISALQEGAAVVVIVSEEVYAELGRPRGLRLAASVTQGVGADEEARAPVVALEKLLRTNSGFTRDQLALVEMSETSAAQALAVRDAFGLDEDELVPTAARWRAATRSGAASAVSVVRLFTRLVRAPGAAAAAGHGSASPEAPSAAWASPRFELLDVAERDVTRVAPLQLSLGLEFVEGLLAGAFSLLNLSFSLHYLGLRNRRLCFNFRNFAPRALHGGLLLGAVQPENRRSFADRVIYPNVDFGDAAVYLREDRTVL